MLFATFQDAAHHMANAAAGVAADCATMPEAHLLNGDKNLSSGDAKALRNKIGEKCECP